MSLSKNNHKLGGKGIIVEVDESKFFKRKYNRGRYTKKDWVVGMVEREKGDGKSTKMKFVTVPKRNEGTLIPIIEKNVEEVIFIIYDYYLIPYVGDNCYNR